MELICFWSTLMESAKELGQARLSKDPDRIAKAEKKHNDYRGICLKADRIVLPLYKN